MPPDAQLQRILEQVTEIRVVQAQQAITLEEHIRRTEAAEALLQHTTERITPLESHVAAWAGVSKAVVLLAAIAGAAAALVKAFG